MAHYLNNEVAVHDYLQQREKAAEKIWRELEAKPDYEDFRERLVARRQAKETTPGQ